MKHYKRILSILLAALLGLGVLLPAHAALPNDLYIETIGSATGLFEVRRTTTWDPLPVPFWASLEDDALAYCLESDRDQPKGDDYSVSQAFYTTRTLTGVQAILMHGAPNDFGGLTTVQACYATQVAIWCWMYESASVGYFFYDTSRLRPASGNQAVYDFFLSLLNKARAGNTSVNHGISVTPSTVTLTESGGVLTGTATVRFTNLNGNYAIDQSKVPAGVTVRGSSYDDGDTITITAPMSYAGQTVSMKGVVVARDTRDPANVFWYEPDKGNTQRLVVYDYSLQPVLWTDLAFTSISKGNLDIIKTVANGGSLAGFQFEISKGGTVIGTYTTDAQGRISVKDLTAGTYSVKEVNLPAEYVTPANNPRQVNIAAGQTSTLDWENTKKQARISIKKTNAAPALGAHPLGGAVFEILNPDNAVVDTLTTNAAGEAESKLLPLNQYRVREVTAPYGFTLNTTVYDVALNYANQNAAVVAAQVEVPEQPQPGVIRVNKSNADAANGDYSLAGAVFEVRTAGGTLVDTITTDAQGKANSKQLTLGEYRVTEKTAPAGFRRDTNVYTAVLAYGGQDTAVVYADVNVPEQPQMGRITVKKTNATPAMGDYPLGGAVFEIFSGSALVDTVTTDAQGEAQSKALKLGSYTVREKTAPYGFVLNTASFTANLEYAGQDVELAVASVTVPEEPQRGVIRLAKTNANPGMGDYGLGSAVFEIRDSEGKLADTITTDSNGQAHSKELPLGSYTVTEKQAPHGFVRNRNTFGAQLTYAGQTVTVAYTDVAVAERPQTGKITVTKKDAVTGGTAQGDATLNGAVFEIYGKSKKKGENLVDTIYCGAGSSATTKELPLGLYYVREKNPPVGYNLDEEFHEVELAYAGQEIEVTGSGYDLKNKVIEGRIAVVKHIDEAMEGYSDPQIEQPLEGAKFHVYLKSAGSYDAAKDTERDILTTNGNGWALSKKLPYGLYVVEEFEAPGDVKLVEPFDVFISQEGKTYYFILNDIAFRSLIKVVKVDAETGKPILLAGTTFKIKDLATGEFVSQHINYPTPADITEFLTAADGTLVLPEPLRSGDYELVEVTAPRGYLLSGEPVKFTVHSSNGQEMVTVTMENKPVMGKLRVEKTGDMLTGAREIETIFGKQYLPIFETGYLAGAAFDVIAAADIVTPDGTVRARKGDVVDHVVTGADGAALSKALYLGEYALVETKAPANYVLDPTPHPVSLVYEDQTVAVVTSQIGVTNARQLIEIELLKKMEGFDTFGHFEDVIFGLFTAEDIYAEDGKLIIAKDSLILTQDSLMALSALDKDGRGRFEGELPFAKYYVLELQTAEGFILDSTKYPVDASYTGEGNAVTRIKVNGGEAIVNKRALGELRILKLDAHTRQPLQGAKFGLYQGDEKIGEGVTDGKGYARFSGLPCGEYQVRELDAPEGYVLVEEIYTIFIRENGQKVLLEVLNQQEPEQPDEPEEPDKPEIPDEPDEPEQPGIPGKPDEPDQPTQPEQPAEPEPGKAAPPAGFPKTGDDTRIALWIGLLCIAAGGVIATLLISRKKKNGETEGQPDEKE